MIGTLIGATILGGLIYNHAKENKTKKAYEDQIRLNQQYFELKKNKKIEKQIKFFDLYRALDAKLARTVRCGYKGVTYLINGLKATHKENDLCEKLKALRNYRNNIAHNKMPWQNLQEPNAVMIEHICTINTWVDNNYNNVCYLVNIGKQRVEKTYL